MIDIFCTATQTSHGLFAPSQQGQWHPEVIISHSFHRMSFLGRREIKRLNRKSTELSQEN